MKPLVIVGGYLTSPSDFRAMAAALGQPPYAYTVFVAPIGRVRWALTRDHDFRPVLTVIRATVGQALETTGADRVTMVAHSTGGTAARLYLGEQPYLGEVFGGRRFVERLVMLGTPHHSQERWTRVLIAYVNKTYPGAYYDDVRYTSVIGHSLRGRRDGRLAERLAYKSYGLVSGPDHQEGWGDGVTTMVCAALRGAEYVPVRNLYHSPFHGPTWYGDPAGVPLWGLLLNQAEVKVNV